MTIDGSKNIPGFLRHRSGRDLPTRGHFRNLFAHPNALNFAIDHSTLIKAHIPASVLLEDLAGLFSFAFHFFPFLVPLFFSRASTASLQCETVRLA